MSTAEPPRPKLLFNFGFSTACKIIAALSSLAVSILIARSLGPSQMGTYSYALWVAGSIAGLASLGLPDAVSKFIAEHQGSGDRVGAAKIARAVILAQIIAAVGISVAGAGVWIFLDRHQVHIVLLAVATILPSALQQTLLAVLEGAQRFDMQAFVTLCGSLCQIAIVAVFAIRHAGVTGFVLANVFSAVVVAGITYMFCRKALGLPMDIEGHAFSPQIVKRILHFSLSVYFLWLLNLIVFDKSEMLFLRIFQTQAEIAYYSIAFGLTARLVSFGDGFSFVLFPIFVTRYAQQGAEGLLSAYRRSMSYLQMLLVPIFVWSIPLAPAFILSVYGGRYARVSPVVQILLVTIILTIAMTVSTSAIFAMEEQKSLFRFMVVVAVLNIALDFLLVPRYGAVGAAFANGVSQGIAAYARIASLEKMLPGSFPALASVKVIGASLLSACPILYVMHRTQAHIFIILLSVLTALILYVSSLRMLGILSRTEVEILRDRFMARASQKAG